MSKEYIRPEDGGYDPKDDPELRDAIDQALRKWKANSDKPEKGTVLTKWLVIAVASGFAEDGEDIDQVMIVPKGSHEDMLGLLAGADTRLRAEIIAAILGNED